MAKMELGAVKELLSVAKESFPHGSCLTCECFLGYVAQLQIDADAEGRDWLTRYKVERNSIHGCLDCDPCPPGDLYADYTRKKGLLIQL